MPLSPSLLGRETKQQRFERLLAQEPFQGLKAILSSLSSDRLAICEVVSKANSYEELLAKLGYRLTLTKQIHVQDCYSRLGRAGGIRAVLPYNEPSPTWSATVSQWIRSTEASTTTWMPVGTPKSNRTVRSGCIVNCRALNLGGWSTIWR